MDEMDEEDWFIEGKDDYVEIEADSLKFTPSERRNLLGHVAAWTARLVDWQVRLIAGIADADGGGMRMEWGVFMCPVQLYAKEKLLVVDTSGVW